MLYQHSHLVQFVCFVKTQRQDFKTRHLSQRVKASINEKSCVLIFTLIHTGTFHDLAL